MFKRPEIVCYKDLEMKTGRVFILDKQRKFNHKVNAK